MRVFVLQRAGCAHIERGNDTMTGSVDKYQTKTSKPHWRYRIYTGKNADGVKQYEARAGFEKQGQAVS